MQFFQCLITRDLNRKFSQFLPKNSTIIFKIKKIFGILRIILIISFKIIYQSKLKFKEYEMKEMTNLIFLNLNFYKTRIFQFFKIF